MKKIWEFGRRVVRPNPSFLEVTKHKRVYPINRFHLYRHQGFAFKITSFEKKGKIIIKNSSKTKLETSKKEEVTEKERKRGRAP